MTIEQAKKEAGRRTKVLNKHHYIYASNEVAQYIVTDRVLSGRQILHTYFPHPSNPTPKINDKFRFDDGTIGTIEALTQCGLCSHPQPAIEVNSRKFGYSTFAIASIECYSQGAGTINYWRVIED